jgi:hypothetical protein
VRSCRRQEIKAQAGQPPEFSAPAGQENNAQDIAVSIAPARPYAEAVRAGRALNFDVIVRNGAGHTATLNKLEIDFEDAAGRVLLSREANASGSMPVLDTSPNRTLGPGEVRLFANPFPIVDAGLPVARVRACLTLTAEGAEGDTHIEASALLNGRQPPRVRLPLEGELLVWSGQDLFAHHRRFDFTNSALRGFGVVSNSGRYAYDLVMLDAAGARVHGDESVAANWVGFGRPVLAPADGVVVDTRADQPDTRRVGSTEAQFRSEHSVRQSHRHRTRAGTIPRACPPEAGKSHGRDGRSGARGSSDRPVGHSGSSLFPHLHFQAMDARDSRGEGVPSVFENFDRIAAGRVTRVRRGSIETGDHVRARR